MRKFKRDCISEETCSHPEKNKLYKGYNKYTTVYLRSKIYLFKKGDFYLLNLLVLPFKCPDVKPF